jgi:hypothetical protein
MAHYAFAAAKQQAMRGRLNSFDARWLMSKNNAASVNLRVKNGTQNLIDRMSGF